MKSITVTALRTETARVLKALNDEHELIITRNGRPVALLTSIDDSTIEQVRSLKRQIRAMNAVHDLQHESVKNGRSQMTMDDIDSIIKESRRERRRSICKPSNRT